MATRAPVVEGRAGVRASLRTKIHLSYLALISMPLLVVAVAAYQTSTTTIEQNAQDFSAQLTSEIRDNLDTYARQAERLTYWPFQAQMTADASCMPTSAGRAAPSLRRRASDAAASWPPGRSRWTMSPASIS